MLEPNARFLVLDDIASIREMLKDHLKQIGFSGPYFEAENVAQAIEIVEGKHGTPEEIQFVLSDWNLPDDTGLNFLKKVRGQDRFKDLPFLMITTENEIGFILDAVNSGVSNYLVKPWKLEDLKEKVEQSWRKHNGGDTNVAANSKDRKIGLNRDKK